MPELQWGGAPEDNVITGSKFVQGIDPDGGGPGVPTAFQYKKVDVGEEEIRKEVGSIYILKRAPTKAWFFSTGGSAGASGTWRNPKSADQIPVIIAAEGSLANQSFFLKAGETYNNLAINLTKGGSQGNTLLFSRWGDSEANPLINLGTRLDSLTWTNESGDIWYVPGFTAGPLSIYIDGEKIEKGKDTNSGASYTVASFTNGNGGGATMTLNESVATSPIGATCVCKSFRWVYETRTVANATGGGNNNLTFGTPNVWFRPAQVGSRVYFEGKKEYLANQNDWWYDEANDRIYMFSTVDPATLGVIYAAFDGDSNRAFRHAQSDGAISDVTFDGIDMQYGEDAFYFRHRCDRLKITNCTARYFARSFADLYGTDSPSADVSDIEITNNTVHEISSFGIFARRWTRGKINWNNFSKVGVGSPIIQYDDSVAGTYTQMQGITIRMDAHFSDNSSNNWQVNHNYMDECGWAHVYFDSYDNCEIGYNVMKNPLTNLDDGGCIYCNGGGGNEGKAGWIHDNVMMRDRSTDRRILKDPVAVNDEELCAGIYLDNGANHFLITGNKVLGGFFKGFFSNDGYNFELRKNIFIGDSIGVAFFVGDNVTEGRNITCTDNLIGSTGMWPRFASRGIVTISTGDYDVNTVKPGNMVIDRNLYWDNRGYGFSLIGSGADFTGTFEAWQNHAHGFDQDSRMVALHIFNPLSIASVTEVFNSNHSFDSDITEGGLTLSSAGSGSHAWVASSPLGTGGALKVTVTQGSGLQYNLNWNDTGELMLQNNWYLWRADIYFSHTCEVDVQWQAGGTTTESARTIRVTGGQKYTYHDWFKHVNAQGSNVQIRFWFKSRTDAAVEVYIDNVYLEHIAVNTNPEQYNFQNSLINRTAEKAGIVLKSGYIHEDGAKAWGVEAQPYDIGLIAGDGTRFAVFPMP